MNIRFNKNYLIPSGEIIKEAIIVGIVAMIVWFLVSSLGLFDFINNLPKMWEVFIIVLISVYIKHLFEVKI